MYDFVWQNKISFIQDVVMLHSFATQTTEVEAPPESCVNYFYFTVGVLSHPKFANKINISSDGMMVTMNSNL